MSTDQLRGNLAATDDATTTAVRAQLARASLQAYNAYTILEAVDEAVVKAHEDGQLVSADLLAAVVEHESGLNLAGALLQAVVEHSTPAQAPLATALATELHLAGLKHAMLADELARDVRELNTPPEESTE